MDKRALLPLLLLLALVAAPLTGPARAQAQPAAAELPVTRVVLFTSGVAYFEHTGTVSGDSRMQLNVAEEHMDDLLQSLVLQDFGGGRIMPVTYDSSDPLERLLASYPLDLSNDPTLAQLLSQARGERVRLVAGSEIMGTILNVERVEHPEEAARHFLTLATDSGLQRIALDQVSELAFLDERIAEQLTQALGAIAANRNDDLKSVELLFTGSGEREVSIGYVREMPVWKTSYRLVLGEDDEAQLQGWAIFDNPTNIDLRGVEVTFVAGQPLSFITELYEPTYVERARTEVATAPSLVAPSYAESTVRSMQRSFADMAQEAAPAPAAAAPPVLQGAGVDAMSEGQRTGSTFSYTVSEPVSVDRYSSAMIPIVQAALPAPRVSVYDQGVLAASPLRAVRLHNDSGLHLAAGPVTVFDEGGYAGTARISDLSPGANGLLTYAVDLELDVETVAATLPQQVVAVSFRQGALWTEVRERLSTRYLITPRGEVDRHLIVVHPARGDHEVSKPEGVERLEGSYRIGVAIGEGYTAAEPTGSTGTDLPVHQRCAGEGQCELEVVMDMLVTRSVSLSNITPEQIAFYLQNVELTEEQEVLLEELLAIKEQIVALDRRVNSLQSRRDAIHADQERVRQNMTALDRDSSLYRRYLTQLEEQEDELQELAATIADARSERDGLQQQQDRLLNSLQQ